MIGPQEEVKRNESVSLPYIDYNTAAALPSQYPNVKRLVIAGEQGRHLQAVDIRADQGMVDTAGNDRQTYRTLINRL